MKQCIALQRGVSSLCPRRRQDRSELSPSLHLNIQRERDFFTPEARLGEAHNEARITIPVTCTRSGNPPYRSNPRRGCHFGAAGIPLPLPSGVSCRFAPNPGKASEPSVLQVDTH